MRYKTLYTALLIGGLAAAPAAFAAPDTSNGNQAVSGATRSSADQRKDAEQQVTESMKTIAQMKSDPEMKKLLSQAKGVYIVPDYGRGALVVGGAGGAGVMLARNGSSWTNPLFYNMGAVSIGAQAGGSAGQVALILMSDKAVKAFQQNNKFSLDAKAGLSIINWSTKAQGSWGRNDVVAWSDTEGLFAGASIAVSDIAFDEGETSAYYGKDVSPQSVLQGEASLEAPQSAQQLKQSLGAA